MTTPRPPLLSTVVRHATVIALPPVVFLVIAVWNGFDVDALGWAMSAVGVAALYLRHRWPVQVAVLTLAVCAVYYPISSVDCQLVLAFAVALYTVAERTRLRAAIALTAVAIAGFGFTTKDSGTPHLSMSAPLLLAGWLVAAVAVGAVIHDRHVAAAAAEQKAREADERQQEALALRAVEERIRIASDLHGVLGQRISRINEAAGAALAVLPDRTEAALEALAVVKQTSKDALRELRATLGVLRQVDEAAPTMPPPDLSRVAELVAAAHSDELAVSVEVDGEPRSVAVEVGLAGFRIVQESLVDVMEHAGATHAIVRIRYLPGLVGIEVEDDGRAPRNAAGPGLTNVVKHAKALGGTFTTLERLGGGLVVSVQFPTETTGEPT